MTGLFTRFITSKLPLLFLAHKKQLWVTRKAPQPEECHLMIYLRTWVETVKPAKAQKERNLGTQYLLCLVSLHLNHWSMAEMIIKLNPILIHLDHHGVFQKLPKTRIMSSHRVHPHITTSMTLMDQCTGHLRKAHFAAKAYTRVCADPTAQLLMSDVLTAQNCTVPIVCIWEADGQWVPDLGRVYLITGDLLVPALPDLQTRVISCAGNSLKRLVLPQW